MTRFAIAALAATLSTAASANVPAIRIHGDSAYIGYSDLDLQAHSGRLQLTSRIRTAATRLCAETGSNFVPVVNSSPCYRVAFASGIEQMEAITGPSPRG